MKFLHYTLKQIKIVDESDYTLLPFLPLCLFIYALRHNNWLTSYLRFRNFNERASNCEHIGTDWLAYWRIYFKTIFFLLATYRILLEKISVCTFVFGITLTDFFLIKILFSRNSMSEETMRNSWRNSKFYLQSNLLRWNEKVPVIYFILDRCPS